ncbi:FCD domain-containing protein [Alkalibaculum sp. M08DMB]|uniref:FCD domain-containing protein n=1 Tax=Alkalibaculum sporogenes TaxID=2655001 RepID=A0A6A7K8Q1_9FIRM|nr:FadR/GntR family transcriptional regulator [Alkalibaculum sporogenes]MPW25567.1 FCD domain-containing protein [Alkalibaculum sporogenes]
MNNFLYEDIVVNIKEEIESGKLIQGEKLPSERMMVDKYGVSRNVIREALKVLTEKGLIAIRPGKGAYVNILDNEQVFKKLELAVLSSKSTLLEILEVREIVEKAIVQKAVEKAKPKDIAKLKELYDSMQSHLISHTNFAAEDAKFHEVLASCTGNSMLKVLIKTFYTLTDKKLFLVSQLYSRKLEQAQVEHKAIIESIEERDPLRAVQAMTNHMKCIKEQLENIEEISQRQKK